MSEKVLSRWNRIQSAIAATLSGLIFILAGITDLPLFGQTYLEFVQCHFTDLDPAVQATIAHTLNIMMTISTFTGLIIFFAALLILFGRITSAKVIIFIVIGSGLIGFIIPIFTALLQGALSLEIILNSEATKYLIAVLLALLARQYASK